MSESKTSQAAKESAEEAGKRASGAAASFVDAVFDAGTSWANQGLAIGVSALESGTKALETAKKKLEDIQAKLAA